MTKREIFVFANTMTHEQIDAALEAFLRERGKTVEKRITRRTTSKTTIELTYIEQPGALARQFTAVAAVNALS